jgi:hypothetical protein
MSEFFVYIIESPSAPDLYHRRAESQPLFDALQLNQIPCISRCAISRVAFDAALNIGLKEELQRFPGRRPIIHFSCHANNLGIELSDGDFISWNELRTFLVPLNEIMQGELVLCMSCCEGYSGIQMAMTLDNERHPYFCLIGTPEKPTWADTCVAFTTLYHRLNKGAHVNDAVNAMRVASGVEAFFIEWAEASRAFYIEYLSKEFDTATATQELTALSNSQPDSERLQQILLEKG